MAGHTLRLAIRATPGAKRTEAAGAVDGALRLRLAAPPVDGKANAALIDWAAAAFDLPKRRVELLRGAAARHKLLALHFDCAAEREAAEQQIAHWMAT